MKSFRKFNVITITLVVLFSKLAIANQEITGSYLGYGNGYEEGLANFKYAEASFWYKAIAHCNSKTAVRETEFSTSVSTNGWDLYTYTSANVVCR